MSWLGCVVTVAAAGFPAEEDYPTKRSPPRMQ